MYETTHCPTDDCKNQLGKKCLVNYKTPFTPLTLKGNHNFKFITGPTEKKNLQNFFLCKLCSYRDSLATATSLIHLWRNVLQLIRTKDAVFVMTFQEKYCANLFF